MPVAKRGGRVLRMGDLGDVKQDSMQLWGEAVINDGDGLMLIVQKYRGANTKEVTEGVEETMAEMAPGLPGIEYDTTIFRPATFIEDSINNLTIALLLGVLLVIVIISAFLYTFRTAFISLISIPLSLLGAYLVLDARNVTINVMVLAGLVVAIGVVVDDAIIDVENIVRRLRQARAENAPSRRCASCSRPRSRSAARSRTPRSSTSSRSCLCSSSRACPGRSSSRSCCPTAWPCSSRCSSR